MKKSDDEPPNDSSLLLNQFRVNQFFPLESITKDKIFKNTTFKIVKDIEGCYEIWNFFSQKQSLFDLWDFRYSWYQGYQYQPFFYTLFEKNTPLACLPLWFNSVKKRYEWFGSDWMEDNIFFYRDKFFFELLLRLLPKKIFLNAIINDPVEINFPAFFNKEKDDPKYVLYLQKFKNIEDYLSSLSKKHRHNLKRDYFNILNKYQPCIEMVNSNDFRFFEEIINLSKKRFNGTLKDHTDLTIPQRIKTYKSILKNVGLYQVKFVMIKIQKIIAAIDLIITYNKNYYSLKGANDINRFPGIGNFINFIEIQDAINNQFHFFDCLQIDYNWKHKYLQPLDLFKVSLDKKD